MALVMSLKEAIELHEKLLVLHHELRRHSILDIFADAHATTIEDMRGWLELWRGNKQRSGYDDDRWALSLGVRQGQYADTAEANTD